MEDILLIITVLSVFVFGYFVMVRLDKVLFDNHETIRKENEIKEPSYIILTDNLSTEEITGEIRLFRQKHKKTRVVLYDSSSSHSFE